MVFCKNDGIIGFTLISVWLSGTCILCWQLQERVNLYAYYWSVSGWSIDWHI
jgi:hypothetical protein